VVSKETRRMSNNKPTEEKKKDPFENVNIHEVLNEDNKKVMMDTMKFFQKMQNQQTQKKTEEFDKNKIIEELKDKLEVDEKENTSIKRSQDEKEKKYKEKIKALETQLLSTDKYDIVILQNQNKGYENQINNLNNQVKNLAEKHETERNRFNNLVGELLLVKDQLIHEINSLDLIKIELMKHRQAPKEKEKERNSQKVEFLLKFVEPTQQQHQQQQMQSKSQKEILLKKDEKSTPKLQDRHKSTKPGAMRMDINSSQISMPDRDESAPQKEDRYKIVRHSKNNIFDNK